jgi:hypothetical protein
MDVCLHDLPFYFKLSFSELKVRLPEPAPRLEFVTATHSLAARSVLHGVEGTKGQFLLGFCLWCLQRPDNHTQVVIAVPDGVVLQQELTCQRRASVE